ncbi:MAG: alpha/beta hydrolase [Gemmatimonadaceae bacterium]
MARPVRIIATALIALVAIGAITYAWKNPENKTLDDAARAGQPGKFVALSQGVTHYEINGPDTGRVVILAHGSSVPLYIWDSTAVALSNAGFRVIRYDRYGIGLSDRPDAAYDSTMFVKQLDELADSLRLTTPFDLMGLSFGGFVTAHYTKAHPERVRTLTLVDPGAASRSLDGFAKFVATTPVVREWFTQVVTAPGAANGQSGDFLHPEHFPGWVDRYRPQMAYKGFGRGMRRTGLSASGTDYNALYGAVGKTGIPVLLVWGRQDPVVPFTYSDSVRKAIPTAEFAPVDSAGHLPHMEQSTFVRDRMLSFLLAHPGTPQQSQPQ